MKVIISHDVDHLFGSDHITDLIYPKLWIRSTLEAFRGDLPLVEWKYRILSPLQKRRNRIDEIMSIDKTYGVKSTFFFGMTKGLGMSYSPDKAAPVIRWVKRSGFDTGLHGNRFADIEGIAREYNKFNMILGYPPFGIRMHYVRLSHCTLSQLAEVGYLYDSSEFNKKDGFTIKAPYKTKNMWEFPLTIMDGYLPYNYDKAVQKTKEILREAQERNLEYLTVLFHDYMYDKAYMQRKKWYDWLLDYFSQNQEYKFLSFIDAICELESRKINVEL